MAMSNQEWFNKQINFVQELTKVAIKFYTRCDEEFPEEYAYSIVREAMPRTRRINPNRFPFWYCKHFIVFHNMELPKDKAGERDQKFCEQFGRITVQQKLDELSTGQYKYILKEHVDYKEIGVNLIDCCEINMCECLRNVYCEDDTGGKHCSIVQFRKKNFPDYVAQDLYGKLERYYIR